MNHPRVPGLPPGLPRRRRMREASWRRERGVTLLETVMVIVIGAVVLASIAGAIAWAAARSGDSWVQKQALAVGESLMSEIGLKAFTRCDADGPPPAGSTVCAIADGLGPEPGESRFSYAAPFDHPGDYAGFAMPSLPGIRKLDGTVIAGLESYAAIVSVQPQALDGIAAGDGLWVEVRVDGPAGTSIRLQSFRARLSP